MEKATLTRLAAKVINTPLMILPDKLSVILSVIGNRIGIDEQIDLLRSDFETPERKDGPSPSNISVIPVYGSLVHRTHGLDAMSGLTSYDEIRNDFRAAMEADTDAVLFDINSPGGEAHGLMDLVDEIYDARSEKPIYAIANESAYSAAYAIASAADKVFLSRSAGVGSVGVIAIHMDQSKYDEKVGVKYTPIYAGARKNDLNPHFPLSSEAKGILQDEVAEHYEIFVNTVARNRNMKVSQVKATEAGMFTGDRAVTIGFADEVMSFPSAVAAIGGSKGAISMGTRETKINAPESDPNKPLEKEVSGMNFDQFSKDHPELLKEIVDKTTEELTVQFTAEKQGLEDKLAQERNGFSQEREKFQTQLAALEKAEAIRREKELKFEAQALWRDKLNASDIPDRLHDKVMNQVSYERFVKDGVLDMEAFEKAVDDEIVDWTERGVTSSALGFGLSVKTVEDSTARKQKQEEQDDDELANSLYSLARGVQSEGKEVS